MFDTVFYDGAKEFLKAAQAQKSVDIEGHYQNVSNWMTRQGDRDWVLLLGGGHFNGQGMNLRKGYNENIIILNKSPHGLYVDEPFILGDFNDLKLLHEHFKYKFSTIVFDINTSQFMDWESKDIWLISELLHDNARLLIPPPHHVSAYSKKSFCSFLEAPVHNPEKFLPIQTFFDVLRKGRDSKQDLISEDLECFKRDGEYDQEYTTRRHSRKLEALNDELMHIYNRHNRVLLEKYFHHVALYENYTVFSNVRPKYVSKYKGNTNEDERLMWICRKPIRYMLIWELEEATPRDANEEEEYANEEVPEIVVEMGIS